MACNHMTLGIIRAQTGTMREWAEQWSREGKEGCGEVAALLNRAAKLADAIATDESFVVEEPPKREESVAEPRDG